MSEPFIVNVADAPALSHSRRATLIDFEPDDAPWPDVGVNIQIMAPGQPNCRYHSEPVQEDFLVLHGECIVILDGEERPMRQWDFLHCPAGVDHVFVGAGDGPCAVLMIGSRREPIISTAHGRSPAPTKTCSVPAGQCTKSHWRSGRSSPSMIAMHSPCNTRKSSCTGSEW